MARSPAMALSASTKGCCITRSNRYDASIQGVLRPCYARPIHSNGMAAERTLRLQHNKDLLGEWRAVIKRDARAAERELLRSTFA
eukprot:6172539-Pleurochrysis_carterae.AAC.1